MEDDKSSTLRSPKLFQCSVCQKLFNDSSNCRRHQRTMHKIFEEDHRASTLHCSYCEVTTSTITDLCSHLRHDHGETAEIQKFQFQNRHDFNAWKRQVEEAGKFNFMKESTKRRDSSTVEYFYCNRSGSYISQSKGRRPSKPLGSIKAGFTCSVFAAVTTDHSTGSIVVTCCLHHYLHDNETARLHLPDNVRREVANYIRDKRSIEWILEKMSMDMQPSSEGQQQLLRRHVPTPADIRNIVAALGLTVHERDKNDVKSVHLLVKEADSHPENPFFFYNPQTDSSPVFTLGIQTNFQRQMLKAQGSRICVDSTHGTQKYKFLLATVLVIDDFGKGQPCAWLVTSNETEDILTGFFKELRIRCGFVDCTFFMSDDAPQYYNSWVAAFCYDQEEVPAKLLCIWHIERNWQLQLSKLKDRSSERRIAVWHSLLILLRAPNENAFRQQLAMFLAALEDGDELEFLNYFRGRYCQSEERIQQWALWARVGSKLNVNMFLESFHNTLKNKFLERKENRRLDSFITILLKVARYYLRQYVVATVRGCPTDGFRQSELHRKHRAAKEMMGSEINHVEDGVWSVQSSKDPNIRYCVRILDEKCDCKLRCHFPGCKICPDMYVCSCADSMFSSVACKHIHLLHMKRSAEMDGSTATAADDMALPDDSVVLLAEQAVSTFIAGAQLASLEQKRRKLTSTLTDILATMEAVRDDHLDDILAKATTLYRLVNASMDEEPNQPQLPDHDGPANKLMEKQPQLFSTRAPRKAAQASYTRPSTATIASIKDGFFRFT